MANRPSLQASMSALKENTKPQAEELVGKGKAAPIAKAPRQPSPTAEQKAAMKKMLIPIDPAVRGRLRVLGLQTGRTLEKVVQDACDMILAKEEKK